MFITLLKASNGCRKLHCIEFPYHLIKVRKWYRKLPPTTMTVTYFDAILQLLTKHRNRYNRLNWNGTWTNGIIQALYIRQKFATNTAVKVMLSLMTLLVSRTQSRNQSTTRSFWWIIYIQQCDENISFSLQVLYHLYCMTMHTFMFQDLWQTFWRMTMGNFGTFSPYSLSIDPCDIDLLLKMNDSSEASRFAVWSGLWEQHSCVWQIPIRISLLMTSVNPGDVGQFSLCGRRLHWWQQW